MIRVREALILTGIAWFAGLVADANLLEGFMLLRVLLPVLAMGGCILHALQNREQTAEDTPEQTAEDDDNPD